MHDIGQHISKKATMNYTCSSQLSEAHDASNGTASANFAVPQFHMLFHLWHFCLRNHQEDNIDIANKIPSDYYSCKLSFGNQKSITTVLCLPLMQRFLNLPPWTYEMNIFHLKSLLRVYCIQD